MPRTTTKDNERERERETMENFQSYFDHFRTKKLALESSPLRTKKFLINYLKILSTKKEKRKLLVKKTSTPN
jgi:hypothetical protein